MARVGSMPCPAPGCGCKDATVSHSATGTRNIKCHVCAFSAYGQAGSKAARLIDAATVRDADDQAAPPAAAPAASPPPRPAVKASAGMLLG
jgi:hypothetical protein